MTKCPRCFAVVDATHYVWALRPGTPGQTFYDPPGSAFSGVQTQIGPMYEWRNPPGYTGAPPHPSEAEQVLKGPVIDVCPLCHFELPPGWRDGHAICIAMAGARATGKSLYIAVLVKQLQLLCERLGVSMDPATRATATAYATTYEKPLFEQRGLIPPTPAIRTQSSAQREPLVFSIGAWGGVRRYLVLRDVAGEDMETGDLQAPAFHFFGRADAVFFMFDPLRVSAIRDQLQDLLPSQNVSGGDPRAVLNHLTSAVGPGQPKLAVILSKFDALRVLRNVEGSEWSMIMSNSGSAYLRDTSDEDRYNDLDGRLLHEEVRSLLIRLNAGSLVAAVENPSSQRQLERRYFVVSALGQPPNGQRLHARGIAPFRCADPVRWVTSGFGVL